jgi:hypothetical protein
MLRPSSSGAVNGKAAAMNASVLQTMPGLLLSGSFLLVSHAGAASMIWDLKADWSNSSNPNGPWSYNEGANPLLYTASWSLGPGQDGWGESSPALPFWFRATSAPMGQEWQVGDILVHTTDDANGAGNGPANVTWTSPVNGFIDISGSAWMESNFPTRGNDVRLLLNENLLMNWTLSGSDPYSRANPFNFDNGSLAGPNALDGIPVAAGDVVRLEYARNSTFGYFVGTELTITGTIPEPSSLTLMAAAGLGLLLRLRQRN